jgi:serine/threonine protein kinase
MASLVGREFGRYRVLEKLGEGGMATVYKALDVRLDRMVALKVIRMDRDSSGDFIKRFEREAKALAKLSHPNIVHVNEYGEFEGTPFIVMDYVPYGTLKQRMGKPILWVDAIRFLIPIAQALDYAHQHNVIHRDVKPANILITENGSPMLSDFGLAKILEGGFAADLSGSGVAGIGTPEYMAPEQVMGKPADGRADMYALAIVLYEMITGCIPFKADTPIAIGFKQCYDPVPDPKTWAGDIPAGVEHVIIKALAKDPARRFPDMATFTRALQGLVQSGGEYHAPNKESLATVRMASQGSKPDHPLPEKKKHRELAVVLAILLPLIGTVAVVVILIGLGIISTPPSWRVNAAAFRRILGLRALNPTPALIANLPTPFVDSTPKPLSLLEKTCRLAGIDSPTLATGFAEGDAGFTNNLWAGRFFLSSGNGRVDFTRPGVTLISDMTSTAFLGIRSDAPNSIFSIRLLNKGVYQLVMVDQKYAGSWPGSKANGSLRVGLHVDNSNPSQAAKIIINNNGTTESFDSFALANDQYITITINWLDRRFQVFDQDNKSIEDFTIPKTMDLSGTYWLIGDPWSDVLDQTNLQIGQICFQGNP